MLYQNFCIQESSGSIEALTANQKLIPTAKPYAGSTYSTHVRMKPPWTGLYAIISPIEQYWAYTIILA